MIGTLPVEAPRVKACSVLQYKRRRKIVQNEKAFLYETSGPAAWMPQQQRSESEKDLRSHPTGEPSTENSRHKDGSLSSAQETNNGVSSETNGLSRVIRRSKVAFYAFLIVLAAVAAIFTYVYISNQEQQDFENDVSFLSDARGLSHECCTPTDFAILFIIPLIDNKSLS